MDDHQMGFIVGRSIMEGMVTIKEVIQSVKRHKASGYLRKLDFEKAYDTINWDCLLETLYLMGFGHRWISWIRDWLLSAQVSILLNGREGRERQGDPCHP